MDDQITNPFHDSNDSNGDTCTSNCISLCLIVINSITFVLYILFMAFIKMQNLPLYYIIKKIIIFLLNISLLVLSIILYCWRKSGSIKTAKKEQALTISIAGQFLSVLIWIFWCMNTVAIFIKLKKLQFSCSNNESEIKERNQRILCNSDNTNYSKGFPIIYVLFVYITLAFTFNTSLLSASMLRIIYGIDDKYPPFQPYNKKQLRDNEIPFPYTQYYGQTQPQNVYVQGNEQYNQREYLARYNMIPNQQYAQYLQQNIGMFQQTGSDDNVNVVMNPGVNYQDIQY